VRNALPAGAARFFGAKIFPQGMWNVQKRAVEKIAQIFEKFRLCTSCAEIPQGLWTKNNGIAWLLLVFHISFPYSCKN
jgi:hypothetical protein